MKIVVGTDFSPNSLEAADLGALIAARLKANLVLAHVADTRSLKGIPKKAAREFLNSAREQLKSETARLRKAGASVNGKFHQGHADEELVREAAAADLAIISAMSWRKHGKWLLGSVAERFSQSAACPTLVLRDPAPFLAWAKGKRALKILCAYDGTAVSDAALNFLRQLKQTGPCEIIVAQIKSLAEERLRLGVRFGNQDTIHGILEKHLKERVGDFLGENPANVYVEESDYPPAMRLIEIATEKEADLILAGTHQWKGVERLWRDSTSRDLLQHAAQSVLLVPSQKPVQKLPRIKRVLVPVSFSPADHAAIRYAYSILPEGGEVHLMTVVHPQELPDGSFVSGMRSAETKSLHQELLDSTAERIKELAPSWIGGERHHTLTEVVEDEDVGDAIVHAAERIGADAIVLWCQGTGKARARLMGSVPQKVLAKSSKPVLLVRA